MVTLKEMIESFEYSAVPARPERLSFWEALTPAAVGGLVAGAIMGIPGLNLVIPLIAVGGYVAAKLACEYYEKRICETDAAKVGAFAGLIGAIVGTLMLMIIATFFADDAVEAFESVMAPQTVEFVLTLSGLDPYLSLITLQMRFIANAFLGVGLGAAGGWLYTQRILQGSTS